MKRPSCSLENTDLLLHHYATHDSNKYLLRTAHLIFGGIFRVKTIYEAGAEEDVLIHLKRGGQLLIAANHRKFQAPLILGSMAQREQAFRPVRGNIVAPGNAPLFNHPILGPLVSRSGAIPVFRTKDVDLIPGMEAQDQEQKRQAANKLLTEVMISKLNRGKHGIIFPEGTRAKHLSERHPTELLPLHKGIGHIACNVNQPDNLLVVATGINYGAHSQHALSATVAIASPFEVGGTVDEVVAYTSSALQRAINLASTETMAVR